jgi:hypothetical protein
MVPSHTAPYWPNRREAAISGNKEPSSDRESPHRFLILTRNIRQGQILINSQTLFLRMPAEKLKFRADDSFPGQISGVLLVTGLYLSHAIQWISSGITPARRKDTIEPTYSYRNATIGSTFVARRAGM